MTDLSLSMLLSDADELPDQGGRPLYAVERCNETGLTINHEIVTGLKLVPITNGCSYDPAADQIENLGQDASFALPTELSLDKVYEPRVVNVSRDWESGQVDDWDVMFVETAMLPTDTNIKLSYIHLVDYPNIKPQPFDIMGVEYAISTAAPVSLWHPFELAKLATTVGEMTVMYLIINSALAESDSEYAIQHTDVMAALSKLKLKLEK